MNDQKLVPEKTAPITMTLDELEIFLANKDWWITNSYTEYSDSNIVIESQYIYTNKA